MAITGMDWITIIRIIVVIGMPIAYYLHLRRRRAMRAIMEPWTMAPSTRSSPVSFYSTGRSSSPAASTISGYSIQSRYLSLPSIRGSLSGRESITSSSSERSSSGQSFDEESVRRTRSGRIYGHYY